MVVRLVVFWSVAMVMAVVVSDASEKKDDRNESASPVAVKFSIKHVKEEDKDKDGKIVKSKSSSEVDCGTTVDLGTPKVDLGSPNTFLGWFNRK